MATTNTKPDKKLSKKEIAALREKLLKARMDILQLYDHDIRAGREGSEEREADVVDSASVASDRELSLSLSNTERERLFEIDEALTRFDKGTYGLCEHSGEPIPIARLEAVPWARYRIEYQELAENGMLKDDD